MLHNAPARGLVEGNVTSRRGFFFFPLPSSFSSLMCIHTQGRTTQKEDTHTNSSAAVYSRIYVRIDFGWLAGWLLCHCVIGCCVCHPSLSTDFPPTRALIPSSFHSSLDVLFYLLHTSQSAGKWSEAQ